MSEPGKSPTRTLFRRNCLYLGGSIKYVQAHFSSHPFTQTSAWTFDFGILLQNLWPEKTLSYRNPNLAEKLRKAEGSRSRGFSFGLAILNSGPDTYVFGDSLRVISQVLFPQLLRVGFAYRPVDTDELGVLVALDVQKVLVHSRDSKADPFYQAFFTAWGQDGPDNLYLGAELDLFHVFAIRFGRESRYRIRTGFERWETQTEWTIGFGLGPEWARLNIVRGGFPPVLTGKWIYLDFSLNY